MATTETNLIDRLIAVEAPENRKSRPVEGGSRAPGVMEDILALAANTGLPMYALQRHFNERFGADSRTFVNWMSGQHSPQLAVLDRYLAATEWKLALSEHSKPPPRGRLVWKTWVKAPHPLVSELLQTASDNHVSPSKLAEKVGINRAVMYRWISGEVTPVLRQLEALAAAMGRRVILTRRDGGVP